MAEKQATKVTQSKAKVKPFTDAILALSPNAPARIVNELVEALWERGYKTVSDIDEADSTVAIYQIGSSVRSIIRTHSTEFFKQAIRSGVALSSDEFSVIGINAKEIYPDCKASFVKALGIACEKQGLRELKNMAHRSAPPLIEIALHNSIRSADDIGFDGQSIYDALTK